MAKIISISNQKGGVGKTTTAVNLSASLAVTEKRVLLVDFDPQGNATSGIGIAKNGSNASIYQVIIKHKNLKEVIKDTELSFLKTVPSTIDLIGAELELIDDPAREVRLRDALKDVVTDFDYIIIDCPPSLSLLTLNALTAANSVIIPLQCEYYALEGLSQLMKTVDLIKKSLNPSLEIEGILLTMFDPRNNLAHQVAQEVKTHFVERVFKTVIPRNVRLSESPSFGKPVILYDVTSKGASSYMELANEIILKN
ncbi:MAG: chromosome partitioning protein ParA [Deltaproteobacteria bacterium GWC2_42_51]|nr:MAG: chromosome partitioning protein ParA [Deltaproteobacteria bacterium GWB2_42_7]OGP35945.1 MAG: chromosome partitioning protein ParA [Deltaproteobacteria bacterium GWC2_42_51]OGP38059.1 MAG: chromosome partitioning protein ParA [Deltaproteobacteria bacterium GWD2_42_10]OGP47605.1 MAG: chromosome partitioning protein ParA [Deltaproteobacteria bacterium GWF2_42_12]OGQ25912.1 MAG: chromosome partitioning protein ParA [Deltaproteobacteria bacterium RIFCSPHIGHO2_02_FULL_42_44]OGQ37586.1 MAG: 